jgi:MFS family permease
MLAGVTTTRRLGEPVRLFASVLRSPDVRRLELAWAASNLARRASAIAVAVYAFENDGISAVGIVLFVRLGVAAVVSPWLAVLADRRPRRTVMLACDLARGIMLAAMAFLVPFDAARPALYVLAVLVVVPEPVFRSAQVAITPSLVGAPVELVAANTIASAVDSVGLFVGPALGGLLIAVSDVRAVFAVTAVLALVSVAFVARIGVAGAPEEREPHPRTRVLLAGWHTIATDPRLRIVMGLFSVQTFVAGLFNVLVVVLAVDLLDFDVSAVGWLDGMVGVGAAAGVLVVAGAAGRPRLARHFGAGMLLWGVPLVLIAVWPQTAVALVLLFLVGVGNTLVDVTGVTLMQRAAPDDVLGRVFGAFQALVLMSMALGSLVAPLLVTAFGGRGAYALAGLLLPLAVLALWRPLSALEALPAPSPARLELLRGVPFFAPLPAPQLERLAQASAEIAVEPGEPVVAEGDPGEHFYIVAAGQAEVSQSGRPVRELGPGDFFGEIALLRDVARTATVRALTPLTLLGLDAGVFLSTVNGDPESAEAAGGIVAARLPGPVIG